MDELEKRSNIVSLASLLMILILVMRLGYVQLVRGAHYEQRAARNYTRDLPINAPRGPIVSRDGVVLVDNRPAYVVSLLDLGEAQRTQVIPVLVEILGGYGVTEDFIRDRIRQQRWRTWQPIRLAVDVSEETVFAIDERRMELPGILVEWQPVRHYPYGNLASYLVGGLGAITPGRVATFRQAGYRLDASVGIFGLENVYELVAPNLSLRGQDGLRQVQVDYLGRLIAELGEPIDPVPGNTMELTIDYQLQLAAEEALRDVITRLNDQNPRFRQKPDRGAAVVLDVKTGAVLAWASYPDFSPAAWGQATDYLWNSNIPLLAFPVGSTFKPITLMAGLLNNVVSPNETFVCNGFHQVGNTRKFCWLRTGHGRLSLEESIKVSCNVVYYQIAQRLVNTFGRAGALDAIGEAAQLVMPGQDIPIDFAPGYLRSAGVLPNSTNFRQIHGYTPYPGEVWDASIGQGIVEFTPLQMASYIMMVANGGYRYQPYVVNRIISPEGEVNFEAEPRLLEHVDLDPASLDVIRRGLHASTLPRTPGGPGAGSAWYLFTTDPIRRDGQRIEVAGKTGTAEVARGITPHSWFISYAPYEEPEIAVAVFVAHGRSGSQGGVPVSHAIYKAYFERTLEEPTIPPPGMP